MNSWLLAIKNWLWPWRWLGLLLIASWIGVLLQLNQHQNAKSAKPLEEIYPWAVTHSLATGTQWMGIYLKEKKMGYMRTTTTKETDGYRITQRSFMQMKVFGRRQTTRITSTVWVNRKYRLKQFSFRFDTGIKLAQFRAFGRVKGAQVLVDLVVAGHPKKVAIRYKPALFQTVLRPYIAALKPSSGQRISTWLFDPKSLSYRKTHITVEKYENITIRGQRYRALRLRQSYQGIQLYAWIDTKGNTLREKSLMGMMFVRESAENASKGLVRDLDVVRMTRIKFVGKILAPKTRTLLRLRLKNVSLSSFAALGRLRQYLRADGVLVVQKELLTSYPQVAFSSIGKEAPVSQPTLKIAIRVRPHSHPTPRKRSKQIFVMTSRVHFSASEGLRLRSLHATPLIQSQNPKIIRQARAITKRAKFRLKALQALAKWVFLSIKKQSVVGVPNALETLERKVGDCNEHASLLAAMARAVGIPCTITSGVAYLPPSAKIRGGFYFHAWNECYVGSKKWVSLDAMWGQFPSDVTHIAFTRGGLDRQVALLRLLGKLQIENVETQ